MYFAEKINEKKDLYIEIYPVNCFDTEKKSREFNYWQDYCLPNIIVLTLSGIHTKNIDHT